MTVHRIAALRQQPNVVRPQTWNANIRAGDDFKLAITVYEDELGTVTDVSLAQSRLVLRSEGGEWRGWDYGLNLWGSDCGLWGQHSVAGQLVDGPSGRLNFFFPSSVTLGFGGRYRALLQIDLPDGTFSVLEGIIYARRSADALGHIPRTFFQLDVTPLDSGAILAPAINEDGIPVDADGFPLIAYLPPPIVVIVTPPPVIPDDGDSSILDIGVLNEMILGSSGSAPVDVLNVGVLNDMVLSS